MRLALNEVVRGRCLEVFAQKRKGCATPQAKWIKIASSNGLLKAQIYDILLYEFK